jgi:carbon-monoxide dehydrogenase large subunit
MGASVRRKEDLRLLTGQGCYSDDVNHHGQCYAVFLRSPHAHARIRAIDTANALAQPGVIAVLTGRDQLADGLKPIPYEPMLLPPGDPQILNKDGTPPFSGPQYALAVDKVR